jgi:hypothetical protein
MKRAQQPPKGGNANPLTPTKTGAPPTTAPKKAFPTAAPPFKKK